MSINLKEYCGLEISLDITKPGLIFGEGINFSPAGIRTLDQMREVILDKQITTPEELYYMYRDVHYLLDKSLLDKHKLRYDVTVIKPDSLGRELMKTAGHYHPGSFGELYEVVHGCCFCLLQRPNRPDHKIIEEAILVRAKAGQKIVIPPGFGHILINPGPDYLVTSNWVSSVFSSQYELYKKAQGAAYFVVKSSTKEIEFITNPYFKQIAKIKFARASSRIDKFGLVEKHPIYPIISQDAKKLDFLNHPLDFDYRDAFVEILKEECKTI